MFVRDWMSSPAMMVAPFVSAAGALQLMEKRGFRRLPVVEEGRLVGILTKSDLLAALGGELPSRRAEEKTVAEIMTRDPLTVAPEQTLETAAQLMLEKKISGLPVVEAGRVVGILTESDIFRALCRMMGFGEPGARVILTVRDGEDVLSAIRKKVEGLSIRSLVTFHDPKRECWDVVLRVRGRVPAATG